MSANRAIMFRNSGVWCCTRKGVLTIISAYAVGLLIIFVMNTVRSYLHPEAPKREAIPAEYKIILYWNAFFREEDFRFGFGHEPFVDSRCPVDTCYATSDKTLLPYADAVMMHGPVVKPLPARPRPHQRYVFVQGEPHRELSAEYLPDLEDMISLTMTYRTDSDIRLPYGVVDHNATANRKRKRTDPLSKPSPVVWVASHCDTPSKREVYVKELKKYIDVDVYGLCGNKRCGKKNNQECMSQFEQRYRFILAFENDFCVDYASEKLYRALDYDIVPVVFGGANYSLDTPPESVIEVLHYPNPKNLAKYLRFLSKDAHAYNEYLAWKYKGYQIVRGRREIMARAMCRLCQILHDSNYVYKNYSDLRHWWLSGSCHRHIMSRLQQTWSNA